ncbi:MAG: U32 family peptidase [Candidatus Adiutrix sp.]|jgi:putative protease|nr:U32 family peptidase [Candidatus Adiutrix sp.]
MNKKPPRPQASPSGPPRPEPPELLAPAGSKAAWAAAVEGGADAVYLGLKDFSARTYADNFSLAELQAVLRESHAVGVKVYLALNSLIKEGELGLAWKLLAAAAALEPDGLILQDLGLSALAARHFPQIPRHASTLTAVHSLPGLITLQKAGFSRAVLSRELAFDEVEALARYSPIEAEIFIHGALCFSFSGLCLMSSFLGGRSALRGGCTQPCRRVYQRGGKKGAFFSTTDLAAAPYFQQLRRLPLASFKIEGRMKGPDYVSRVVRAYRMLLDAPEAEWPYALAEAENILAEAPGRRTTGGPLAAEIEGALAPLSATTSGLKVGFMEPAGPGRGRLTPGRPLAVNDRLRLQPKAGEESAAFNLKTITLEGREVAEAPAGRDVILGGPNLPSQPGFLFKVSSGNEERAFLASPLVRAVKEAAPGPIPAGPKALPPELRAAPGRGPRVRAAEPARGAGYWVWLERLEDVTELANFPAKKVILPLTVPNVRHLRHHRRLKEEVGRLVWSLPPLIFHRRQSRLGQEIADLLERGAREFMISNLGQINLIQRAGGATAGIKIWGDHRLGALNHLAEAALISLGLAGVTLSLEADAETYQALWAAPAAGGRLLYLYGRPALFTARYPLDQRRTAIVSPRGEKFHLSLEGDQTIVVAERPVLMAPLLKMPPLPGAAGLILDLRQEAHLGAKLQELKKSLAGARNSQGSVFNFKRSLM